MDMSNLETLKKELVETVGRIDYPAAKLTSTVRFGAIYPEVLAEAEDWGADLIVVDEKEQARVEGGNLLRAIAEGRLTWDRVEELGDIVTGRIAPPDFAKSNILFESHGLAINDMAMAAKTYELARAAGIGRELEL